MEIKSNRHSSVMLREVRYEFVPKMSIVNRGFNNIFWISVSEISSKGLIFLGTIYLARILGKAGFGLFSLALTIGVYLWTIADLGVAGYGVREVAKNREKTAELYSLLNSLRFVLSLCLFLIFSGALYIIDMPIEKKLILLSGGVYPVTTTLSSDWVFRGLEKMQYIVVGSLTASLFYLGNIFLFVKGYSDTATAVLLYSNSFLAGSLISMILLRRKLKMPFSFLVSFKDWRFHIKESFYFAMNRVFNNVSSFVPILFMGMWSTAEELGVFSAPHRLTTTITFAGGLVISALYPTLSNLYVTDRDAFKKTHTGFQKLIIVIAVPVCIIATILSKDIIMFIFGSLYVKSIGIFNVLIWLSLLVTIRHSFGNALLSAGFHRFNMIATGTGAVIVLLVSIVLIPKYSGYGAAFALICGEIFILILMIGLFREKVYRSVFLKTYLVKILLASMLMGLLIIGLNFSMAWRILIGVLAYGFMLLTMGIVSKETFSKFIKT